MVCQKLRHAIQKGRSYKTRPLEQHFDTHPKESCNRGHAIQLGSLEKTVVVSLIALWFVLSGPFLQKKQHNLLPLKAIGYVCFSTKTTTFSYATSFCVVFMGSTRKSHDTYSSTNSTFNFKANQKIRILEDFFLTCTKHL